MFLKLKDKETKNSVPGVGYLLMSCWSRKRAPKAPKMTQALAFLLGSLPEIMVSLKTPPTFPA